MIFRQRIRLQRVRLPYTDLKNRSSIVLFKSFERISRETFRKDYTLRSFSEGGSLCNRSGLLENAIVQVSKASRAFTELAPGYLDRFETSLATLGLE